VGNSLVAIVLVTGAVVTSFTGGAGPMTPARSCALVAGALAYTLAVTLGAYWLERSPTPRRTAMHFASLLLLGAIPCVASRGYASIVLLVVASQAELYLPRRFAVVVWALTLALPLALALIHAGGVPIFLRYVAAMGFVVVFSRIAKRERQARAEVESLSRRLQELAAAKERNRIARDIHDGLGHCLTAVHVHLQAAEAFLARDLERAGAAVSRAKALTHDGLAEVRASVSLLRAAGAPGGLLVAIERLCHEARDAGVAAEVKIAGQHRTLAPDAELTLYRAVQEALTNVRKHARATKATVELRFEAERVLVSITDDGIGGAAGEGFGLSGLRERVQGVGGRAWFDTSPGRGFAVHAEVPA
jgi:signal transduction histidine kinase